MGAELEWVLVAKEEELQENARLVVTVQGRSILLLKRAGRIAAVSNRCPHLGCPLARGKLDGFILTCPCHDWTFDIRTGEFTMAPEIKLETYPWRIRNDHIYIQIDNSGEPNG